MGFLTGKTAIITGAGYAVLSDGRCGSIGYGIATAYAKEGANLVITGRNVAKLEKAKEELERLYGIRVLALQAFSGVYGEDVVDKQLSTFVRKFYTQQFKRNCAPDGPKVGTVGLSPRGDWQMPSDMVSALWKGQLKG